MLSCNCDKRIRQSLSPDEALSIVADSQMLWADVDLGKNIGQNIVWCSLMWLMPLISLSNCDYEKLPRLILGPIHPNQVMGTDPVGSHHGTLNSRSNSINPTYPYQSHN